MVDRPYPSGIFSPSAGPPDDPIYDAENEVGNDPSWLSGPYLIMSEAWQPVLVCMGGTQTFRENAEILLPLEPKEDVQAWKRRVSHAVLSPFLTRLADQAAGLICRKPITFKPKEENGEVDPYWEDFVQDVDGYGTDLDSFARRLVFNSILLGHSACLVDFPATEPAPNLQIERQLGLRPYFLEVRADQILGWRKEEDSPLAPICQIRINEYVQENVGLFGDKVVRQIRVLEKGSYSIWRKGESGWYKHDEGQTSLPVIPLAVTYSGKLGELMSSPPLLPIANLNIAQAQRSADLQHALHVAALPVMYIKAFEDSGDEIALSANSAILLPENGEVGYAEPASSAFESQQSYITELENQMRNLGISTLFNQTYVGETAEAKAMDRSDSDSMLSVVAQDLEQALQNAMDLASAYSGIEAPLVQVSRDFNLQQLDGQQVGQYMSMWTQGAITHETLLNILARGEVLPDINVEEEIEMLNQEKLASLDLEVAGGTEPQDEGEDRDSTDNAGGQSDIRQEVIRRLRNVSSQNNESD